MQNLVRVQNLHDFTTVIYFLIVNLTIVFPL